MTETIREKLRAVYASGTSLYKIAKATGMKWDTLKRFHEGENLRAEHIDSLAKYLELQITDIPKPKPKRQS